jgi:hypothetical protein
MQGKQTSQSSILDPKSNKKPWINGLYESDAEIEVSSIQASILTLSGDA